MKKIFFVINSLEGGGAENVVRKLSYYVNKDYNVSVIILKDKSFYELPKGINLIKLSGFKSNIFPFFMPLLIYRLRKLISKEKPDYVISFLEWANFLNILSNKNAIISLRIHLSFFRGFSGVVYKILINWLYPKAKMILVNSAENKFDLSLKFNNVIEVLYNPVDFRKISKEKKEYEFISVGRLIAVKHFDSLIEAFDNYSEKKHKFVVVGDGPKREYIKEFLSIKGLQSRVLLVGAKTNVHEFLAKSNYFLYASEVEGFPNVLIEAMYAGIPIITTDFKSGAREVIDPTLDFSSELIYPYYGPNGVLISKDFSGFDLSKIDFSKVSQKKKGFSRFEEKNVVLSFKSLLKKFDSLK